MRRYAILITLAVVALVALSGCSKDEGDGPSFIGSAAEAGQDEPAARQEPIPVHIAEGMWGHHWRLPEALAEPPGKYRVTMSFATQRYNWVHALKYFPETKEELFANKVLVLGNINHTAFERKGPWDRMQLVKGRSVDWVEEFVRQGGGLFLLGGNVSLGMSSPAGKFNETSLAKVLPAQISDEADIHVETQNRPVALTPAGSHPILKSLNWQEKPVTLFYHEVKPRPGSTVIIKAGEAPIMILGTYGKGRVALFVATLHGDPPENVTPYWEWESWPQLVRNTVDWLQGAGGN